MSDGTARTRILFVCEGNISRSPMAEWLAKHTLGGVRVESAGILKLGGRPMAQHSLTILRELGIDASSHVSRNVGAIDAGVFDVVVALHQSVATRLPVDYGITPDVVWDVPDPHGTGIDGYRVTYAHIAAGLRELAREIRPPE
jgi:protein-tyrosine phosphatase